MCDVFDLVFFFLSLFSFLLWSWIDISDVFLRERSRDDTFAVVRDRKVSPNSLTLHALRCICLIGSS